MKIYSTDFYTIVQIHLAAHAAETVVAVIDEQPGMFDNAFRIRGIDTQSRHERRGFRQRWGVVTSYQLRVLNLAAASACKICEISFGGPSTDQVRAMLGGVSAARLTRISKRNANALQDEEMQLYVASSPKYWIVMGYDVDACVASTCGVTPVMKEDCSDQSMTQFFGLLQYGKTILTADTVLHPAQPSGVIWSQLEGYKRLTCYFDLVSAPG